MKGLIEKIDKLAELASELKQQLQDDSPSDTGINWKLMPVDTLVEDKFGGTHHLSHADDDNVYVFVSGHSSYTANRAVYQVIDNPRLAKNQPWRPWFGGECPVDPNVMVDYILRDAQSSIDYVTAQAEKLWWKWWEEYKPGDIIAWRIADKQEENN